MAIHQEQASGAWYRHSLAFQLANVGTEVGRIRKWQTRNPEMADRAFVRALELLDLTLGDPRWNRRLKEIARVRSFLCGAVLGAEEYGTTLEDLDRYFLAFATAARNGA